jgi:hypothetical protein
MWHGKLLRRHRQGRCWAPLRFLLGFRQWQGREKGQQSCTCLLGCDGRWRRRLLLRGGGLGSWLRASVVRLACERLARCSACRRCTPH